MQSLGVVCAGAPATEAALPTLIGSAAVAVLDGFAVSAPPAARSVSLSEAAESDAKKAKIEAE